MVHAPAGLESDAPVIEIVGLSKAYPTGRLHTRRRAALADLSLAVGRGEVFGYLGPNGSGKSTTLKLLMGLVLPDAGRASILGVSIAEPACRKPVGYLPENPYFYDYLTPLEYLDYAGRIFGIRKDERSARARDLIARLGLEEVAGWPLRRFSKGMLQRLGLAQALVADPLVVFLDEPMSGLDPIGRRFVRDLILELKQRGKTVFFSTHILSDAEALCDRVALLRRGSLLASGRLDEILNIDVSHLEVLASGLQAATLGALPAAVALRQELGERTRLEVAEGSLGAVVLAVEKAGGRVLAVQPIRQSLEDYFMKEMGPGQAKGGHGLD
jgi:ABC-2 type transport system ATP-binding protein